MMQKEEFWPQTFEQRVKFENTVLHPMWIIRKVDYIEGCLWNRELTLQQRQFLTERNRWLRAKYSQVTRGRMLL